MNKIGTGIFVCYHKIFGGNIANQLLPQNLRGKHTSKSYVTKNVTISAFFDPKMPSKFVTISPKLNSKSGERTSRIVVSGLGGI
jgi:hypothetical protein